jgi:hypothetical protein
VPMRVQAMVTAMPAGRSTGITLPRQVARSASNALAGTGNSPRIPMHRFAGMLYGPRLVLRSTRGRCGAYPWELC